jgi:hypothetical protein
MLDTLTLLPSWAVPAQLRPASTRAVPEELLAHARKLALEDWGEAAANKRDHVERFVRTALGARADAAFSLDRVGADVLRHQLQATVARLAASHDACQPLGVPVTSRWRALKAMWGAVNRIRLEARARRLAEVVATDDAKARLAAAWCDDCAANVMAAYDIDFLRGAQVANRSDAPRGGDKS